MSEIAKRLDALLTDEEQEIKKWMVQSIWKTGETLLRAKAKIIKETGDKRAPGFTDWHNRKFGFKKNTASRMIKAYETKNDSVASIWGNERSVSLTTPKLLQYTPHKGDPEIHEGDAIDFLSTDKTLYDLICIDPPYNMGDFEWDKFKSDDDYFDWCGEWLALASVRLKETGSIYVFGIFESLRRMSLLMDRVGYKFRDYIIWDHIQGTGGGLWVNRHEDILYYSRGDKPFQNKEAVTIAREEDNVREYGGKVYDTKNLSNIWRCPVLDEKSPERVSAITQKPIQVLSWIIAGSCPTGGTALDFFAGSGSFGIACMRAGVKCTLVEKLPDHVSLIKNRIATERGNA